MTMRPEIPTGRSRSGPCWTLITGHLIDDVLYQPANAAPRMDLIRLGAVSVVLLFFLGVAAYFRSRLAQELASNLQHNLRRRMFHHIQRLSSVRNVDMRYW